jgi:hypothetical protein
MRPLEKAFNCCSRVKKAKNGGGMAAGETTAIDAPSIDDDGDERCNERALLLRCTESVRLREMGEKLPSGE